MVPTRRISFLAFAPLLVVGAVLTFVGWQLAGDRERELEAAAITTVDVARMAGERIDRALVMIEFLLSETADDLGMDPAALRQRMRQRQAYFNVIDRFSVYDGAARLVASTSPAAELQLDPSCYDFREAAMLQLHPMLGDTCPFSVTRSVLGEDGAVSRIMVAVLSPSVLGDLFELQRELGPGGRMALLGQAASPLLAFPSTLTREQAAAMTAETGAGFAAHGSRSYIGNDLIVGLYQLRSYPMRLLVGIQRSHVLGLWRQDVRGILLFSAVLVLGAAAWSIIAYVWQGRRQLLERRLRHEELQRLRAEEASRTKSQFLQYMSHELRTPLNAILGFSEIIRDRHLGAAPERYSEYAADIHASGRILLDIINDLLEIAKIEAGKLEMRSEDVALHELVREAADLLRTQVRKSGLEIHYELAPCFAVADRRAILQVLLNLLSNAVKYTPPGGRVILRSRQEATARVEIEDTGRGMDESTLTRVLKPFEQADNRLDLAQMGTGLGLAVTSALVEKLGGTLSISSVVGEGTVAAVELPAAERAPAPTRSPITRDEEAPISAS